MKRRKFLQRLGLLSAAMVATPPIVHAVISEKLDKYIPEKIDDQTRGIAKQLSKETPRIYECEKLYISLHTAEIDEESPSINELKYPGYERIGVPKNDDGWVVTNYGTAYNNKVITFPKIVDEIKPQTITNIGISTSDGILLFDAKVSNPLMVSQAITVELLPEALIISEENGIGVIREYFHNKICGS